MEQPIPVCGACGKWRVSAICEGSRIWRQPWSFLRYPLDFWCSAEGQWGSVGWLSEGITGRLLLCFCKIFSEPFRKLLEIVMRIPMGMDDGQWSCWRCFLHRPNVNSFTHFLVSFSVYFGTNPLLNSATLSSSIEELNPFFAGDMASLLAGHERFTIVAGNTDGYPSATK